MTAFIPWFKPNPPAVHERFKRRAAIARAVMARKAAQEAAERARPPVEPPAVRRRKPAR